MPKNKNNIEVEVAEVVDYMRMMGTFAPALSDVVNRKITLQAARDKKIKVTSGELQKASDTFRLANGLTKARDTERWLKANGLTVDSFENFLETNLMVNKFKGRLQKTASKTKYLSSPGIQESLKEMAFQDWLSGMLK